MKKVVIGCVAVFVAFILITCIAAGTILSSRNTAVTLENKVKAQYASNQASYDGMWKTFVEMTQVTDLQAKQMKEVYTGLISGRYQDPNLLFKMVKEDNPKLDTTVYTKIQQAIEAGRKGFTNDQKKVLDIVREYNTYIQHHFIMAAITGRTQLDENKYITTSDRTKDAFNSGKDGAVNLNGK
ncbi:MAG: hypothetical protein K0R18_170 [Bacillales bacterium]|jgi:exosome complex RNA-binding protein Csl4|nr:hypothetical protein [Bacillales bacterium]